jgi:hypothetical protein
VKDTRRQSGIPTQRIAVVKNKTPKNSDAAAKAKPACLRFYLFKRIIMINKRWDMLHTVCITCKITIIHG